MSPAIIIIAVMAVIAVGVVGAMWAVRPTLDIPYSTWKKACDEGTLWSLNRTATGHCLHPWYSDTYKARCCLCNTSWKKGDRMFLKCPKRAGGGLESCRVYS